MASNSVGQVTVEIVADASKFEKDLSNDLNKGVEGATKGAEGAAEKGGKGIGGAISRGLGGLLKLTGVGIGALFSASLVKGFGRLNAIDQAERKLEGLGNSAAEVTAIMDQSLKSVQGTAFGLGEAATLSAAFMTAGVQAGTDLEAALNLTVDAASLAGTSLADMGDVMVDVAASGKLTGDELNRLNDRGIDALSSLSKHYDITRQEAQKMVSDGEVSFEMFAAAMEADIGMASTTSGETFVGAMKNIGASLGRFGAQILKPFFEGVKAIIPEVIAAIDGFTEAFKPIMEEVGPQVAKAFETIGAALSSIDWVAIGELVVGMARVIWNAIVVIIAVIKDWIASMQPALTKVLTAVKNALDSIDWDKVVAAIQAITPLVVGMVAAWMTFNKVKKVVAGVKGAIAGVSIATKILRGDTVKLTAAQKKSTITMKLHTIATKLHAAATKTATIVTKAFKTAMKLLGGPIGLIITLVGLLVAALVWFFTQTELGQEIVKNVIDFMVNAWQSFVDWIVPLWEGFIEFWVTLWTNVSTFFTDIWNALVAWFQGIWAGFIGWWQGTVDAISAWWTGVWEGIKAVFTTVWDVMTAIAKAIFYVYIGWLIDLIMFFVENWNTIWTNVKTFFTDLWDNMVKWVKNIWQGFIDWINGILDSFVSWWEGLWESVKDIAQRIWDKIKEVIMRRVELIIAIFTGDFAKVKQIISDVWNSVKDKTIEIWNSIIAWIKEIPTKIKNVFTSASEWLKGAGRDIMEGLWNGLKEVWENVKAWFDEKMGALAGMARSITDSHSPSRVFVAIGEDIGEGLEVGLDNSAKGIMAAAKRMMETPINTSMNSLGAMPTSQSAAPTQVAGATTTFNEGAVQVMGVGDPYKAALLAVNGIASRVAI